MAEPDPWRGQLAFHEMASLRRQHVVFDWEGALSRYMTTVLTEGEPLRFSLMAGQPVYNVFGTEMHVVSEANQRLDVYLDAARRWMFSPSDILVVGTPTMETFLIRIDFVSQPDFDTNIFNRLRLEHVVRSIRQSSPTHYGKLLLLYLFRRYCQVVLPGHHYQIPLLEDAYDFYPFL